MITAFLHDDFDEEAASKKPGLQAEEVALRADTITKAIVQAI